MALSLGVRKGSKIAIGPHEIEVRDMVQPNLIVLTVDDGEPLVVSDLCKTFILPEVGVFTGVGKDGQNNRLAFEAPRHIAIRRLSVVAEPAAS